MNLSELHLSTFKSIFKCEPVPGGVKAKPIYNQPEEFKTLKGYYEIVKEHPALPPVGSRIPFMSGIQVVKPLPGAEVYATYEGKPCIVGTKRSLYVGTDIAIDLAMLIPPAYRAATDEICQITANICDEKDYKNALQVLTGFARYAGVQRPVTVTLNGQPVINITAGLLEKPGVRLVALTENQGIPGKYSLNIPVAQNETAWDLTRSKSLEKEGEGKFALDLDGYDWRLVLISDEKTVAEAVRKQADVDRLGKAMPYRLTRFFFITSNDHGRSPINNHFIHEKEDIYLPAAIIAMPKDAPSSVMEKVKEIQELIKRMSRKEIADKCIDKLDDKGALIPIVPAEGLDEKNTMQKNILFIGSGKLNPITDKWISDKNTKKEIEEGQVVTIQENPWRNGGNLMVVSGNDEAELLKNLDQLQNDLVIWFNRKQCSVPRKYLQSAFLNFTKSIGWILQQEKEEKLIFKKPDGSESACFVYSRYDDNFSTITDALRKHPRTEATFVFGYANDLNYFKSRLVQDGWKQEGKSTLWKKGDEKVNFSFASTDRSLNEFLKNTEPMAK